MASLMASQTLLLRTPNTTLYAPHCTPLPSFHVSLPTFSPAKSHRLRLRFRRAAKLAISASTTTPTTPFTDSTRTVSAILASALAVSKVFIAKIQDIFLNLKQIDFTPNPEELAAIRDLRSSVVCAVGPLFFAAARDRPSGYLNTPLTVVAAGMAKWLDIYSGVLMVRVLLSWFPNIPWDRQPLSAIRDLCDPYLNLFRNIIPPVFDTLDVSPLLAFAVLGTLGSILNNSRGMY